MVIFVPLVCIAALFLPIEIPYTFKSVARVYPANTWKIIKDHEGNFASESFNFKTGTVGDFTSFVFDRGDITNIELNPNLQSQQLVKAGDTIATIRSFLLNEKVNQLTFQLQVEKANLTDLSTGQRQSEITEADQRISFAEEQQRIEQIKFDRIKGLYQEEVISRAEYDNAENALRLAQVNLNMAKQNKVNLSSGSKPETVLLAEARIKSIEQELRFAKSKGTSYTITSPMSGVLHFAPAATEVLTITDTSELVLSFPVDVVNNVYIDPETIVKFRNPRSGKTLESQIYARDDKVQLLNQREVIFTRSLLKNNKTAITPGLSLPITLDCGSITLSEFVDRNLQGSLK